MNLKSKEIKRSVRDLESICYDLSNASEENYLSIVRRLMFFIKNNRIISQIVDPLFNIQIESSKYLVDLGNGWGEIIVPEDITIHLAFTLKLFYQFINDPDFSLIDFSCNYYRSADISDNIYKFQNRIVGPALREMVTRIKDYIQDELEGKDEVELGSIQVFTVGSIQNQSGNIIFGNNNNISQVNNLDRLTDEFAKTIIQQGYSLKEFDQLRTDIEQLRNELKHPVPEVSKIETIFKKVLSVGGPAMLNILVTLISKPDITTAIVKALT
jgi:hypothetical protein